ncbi:MAG: hypothetical protein NC548_34600 [Lachnospiraceae bacterium]|nr:hypothetical protein [Lachnospiraceae bacterium]MCM1231484.1 hypothetical protein [Ruminococcus flavefaciens]
MRVFVTELKKLLGNKIFLLIIAAVFVLNGYLMFRMANSRNAKPEQYKEVYSCLNNMSDTEKLNWLDKRLTEFEGQHNYNWEVLGELRDECANIVCYGEYLNSIDAQAKSMTSVSIFANHDTFNYRSIVKTPSAYNNVRDVKPVFDVSKGINLATENSFTDILCGFIVLYAVLSLMISDREQGMSGLLFALKRGRGYLLFSKLLALAVTVFLAVFLIYGENLIVSSFIYGLGDLSRPIQSVAGFIGCNLKINVAEYLVIFGLFKFTAVFTIGAVLSFIAVTTKNTVSFYGISAALVIIEGLLYALIHPLSIYSIFRYINVISFTKVNEIFCNYKNINFFEYPIQLIPASFTAIILISLICSVLSAYLYAKKRNLEFRKIRFKLNFGKGNKIHSALYYGFYKSLIQQKGIFIVVVFLLITVFLNSSFKKNYDVQDVYYKYYTNQLEGEITSKTDDFIKSEEQHFFDLNNKLNEILQNSNGFSVEANEIQKQLAAESGFMLLKNRYELIRNIDKAQIFYDTGYKRMFGKVGYDDDMKYALVTMMLCIFLISPLIANDNKYRMLSIINSTASGKKQYIRRNIIISIGYGLLASLMWLISYSFKVYQFYGFGGVNSSIQSITDFIDFPINLKLWQYFAVIFILRTIFVILSALFMLWISSKCKNSTIAVLINFAVFVLPVIVYLLGADIMVNICMNPMLSVNAVLNNFSVVQLAMPVLTLGIIFYYEVKRKKI